MSVFKTKKFKVLQSRWYQRLKRQGFHDIETRHGTVITDLSARMHFRVGVAEANYEYYSWAESQLRGKRFRTRQHRIIWALHAAGKKPPEIGRVIGLSRWRVEDLVKEISGYLKGKR